MFNFSSDENEDSDADQTGTGEYSESVDDEESRGSKDESLIGFDDGDDNDDDPLQEIEESQEELECYTVKELKVKLVERGLIQTGNKADLIERLLNPQPSDFKNKTKIEPWKTSKAKALLIRLLSDKSNLIRNKSPTEVWQMNEWFKQYPLERFINNMKNLEKALDARGGIVANDNREIEAELTTLRALNQQPPIRGYPLWHEHPAMKLLEQDIKDGLHEGMTPLEFRATRPEYKEFDINIFRKHIYQEERKQMEMPMKVAKRNKLASAKHKDEVDEELARWYADQKHNEMVNEMADLML